MLVSGRVVDWVPRGGSLAFLGFHRLGSTSLIASVPYMSADAFADA